MVCGVQAGENLRGIKADLIAEILKLPNELEFLRSALIEGRVDGSTYTGDCACLAGTLAHAKGIAQSVDLVPMGARAVGEGEDGFGGVGVGRGDVRCRRCRDTADRRHRAHRPRLEEIEVNRR